MKKKKWNRKEYGSLYKWTHIENFADWRLLLILVLVLLQQNRFGTASSFVCTYACACACVCMFAKCNAEANIHKQNPKKTDRYNFHSDGKRSSISMVLNWESDIVAINKATDCSLIFYLIFGFVTCCSKYNRATAMAQQHILHFSSFAIRHWRCCCCRSSVVVIVVFSLTVCTRAQPKILISIWNQAACLNRAIYQANRWSHVEPFEFKLTWK